MHIRRQGGFPNTSVEVKHLRVGRGIRRYDRFEDRRKALCCKRVMPPLICKRMEVRHCDTRRGIGHRDARTDLSWVLGWELAAVWRLVVDIPQRDGRRSTQHQSLSATITEFSGDITEEVEERTKRKSMFSMHHMSVFRLSSSSGITLERLELRSGSERW